MNRACSLTSDYYPRYRACFYVVERGQRFWKWSMVYYLPLETYRRLTNGRQGQSSVVASKNEDLVCGRKPGKKPHGKERCYISETPTFST